LQIVAATCPCSEPDIVPTAAIAAAKIKFRDTNTSPPRCLKDDKAMESNAYARAKRVMGISNFLARALQRVALSGSEI
jgi:hypothetical protein